MSKNTLFDHTSSTITIENATINIDEPIQIKTGRSTSLYKIDDELSRWKNTTVFPERKYNFPLISNIYEMESYFRQFVEKCIQRLFREPFEIIGDEKIVKYINLRITIMEKYLGYTFDELVENIAREMLRYSNCYLEKIRNKNAPEKTWGNMFGKPLAPVISYAFIPVQTMYIRPNQFGKVMEYKQVTQNETSSVYFNKNKKDKFWKPEDIVHFYIDKQPKELYGTPIIAPIINDIRGLRTMEESGEIIVFQYAKPILFYKADTQTTRIYTNPQSVIDDITDKIEQMETCGYVVGRKGDDMEYVGANGVAIDITPYLEYFKTRLISGFGLDPVTLGEPNTGNRDTAQTMTENMVCLIKQLQRELKRQFIYNIFQEWMYEGKMQGYVDIYFPEVDIESKIKKDTHTTYLYEHNMLTHAEARLEMKKHPLPIFGDKTNYEIQIQKIKETNEVNLSRDKEDANKKETDSRNVPTTQYGTKSRPKVKQD